MNIFLSDLQEKDIISVKDGLNYGKIEDVLIDEKGNIISFVARKGKFLKTPNKEVTFTNDDIEKIGKDVIIIKK